MGDISVEKLLSLRSEHAEGPIWDAATERLWWVDITAERVHCFDPQSGAITATGEPVSMPMPSCIRWIR